MQRDTFETLARDIQKALEVWRDTGDLKGVGAWSFTAYIDELESRLAEAEADAYGWSNRLTRVEAATAERAPYGRSDLSSGWSAAMRTINEAMEEK